MKFVVATLGPALALTKHAFILKEIIAKCLKYGPIILVIYLYGSWNIDPTVFVKATSLLLNQNLQAHISKISIRKEIIRDVDSKKQLMASEVYSFYNIKSSFNGLVPVDRVSELDAYHLEELIMISTPHKLRAKLKWFLRDGLNNSVKYRIDPFWSLSIMWVESHFNPQIESRVGAIGPMQIMPLTGKYLAKFLAKKGSSLRDYTRFDVDPFVNIEMGIYYLSGLLKRYNNNYTLATVAYNMGPTWVDRRMKKQLPVGVKNHYLDKVRVAYKKLTHLYKIEMRKTPLPYKGSFAYVGKKSSKTPYNLLAAFSFEIRRRKSSLEYKLVSL